MTARAAIKNVAIDMLRSRDSTRQVADKKKATWRLSSGFF